MITSKGVLKKVSLTWLILGRISKPDFFSVGEFFTIAIPLSFYYYVFNTKILEDLKKNTFPFYNFLLNKWYIDELYDSLFVKPTKKIGSFFWKKGDIGVIDRFGPDGISKLIKIISNKAGRLQTGFIYDYAFVMLIGLSILLTYLILN